MYRVIICIGNSALNNMSSYELTIPSDTVSFLKIAFLTDASGYSEEKV